MPESTALQTDGSDSVLLSNMLYKHEDRKAGEDVRVPHLGCSATLNLRLFVSGLADVDISYQKIPALGLFLLALDHHN